MDCEELIPHRRRQVHEAEQRLAHWTVQRQEASRIAQRRVHQARAEIARSRIIVVQARSIGAGTHTRSFGQMGVLDRLTVHHLVTANPTEPGSIAQIIRSVDSGHARLYGGLGYQELIDALGRLIVTERGRRGEIGAHTARLNTGNWGIGLLGDFENGAPPTTRQLETLWQRVTQPPPPGLPDLRHLRSRMRGHLEQPGQSTACPGRRFLPTVREMRRR